jgi:RNA polymerase sigma-70 factor (ECF subfamily)
MHDPTLDNMVRRVQRGDLEAFEAIVRQFQRPLRGWIIARCSPLADADAIAQETFLQAFKRIDGYSAGTDFSAWLFTIARYQLMAESTRLRRVADYHSRYAPYALARELERRAAETPAASVDDRIAHLQTCVAALDAGARRAIDLRYAAGLPLADIAEQIGRTEGATRKYLHVLRQKLRECVERKLSAEGA